MFLPTTIIAVLSAFQPAFTRPTYQKMVVLIVGTLLASGRRTVASALRQMGFCTKLSQHIGNTCGPFVVAELYAWYGKTDRSAMR